MSPDTAGIQRPIALEARGLTKIFNDKAVVDRLNLTVYAGDSFGFLGPNGAGKTSTMRMAYCCSPVSSGELRVLGEDVMLHPRHIKGRLGVVPQEDNLDPDLTVAQNLVVYGRYHGLGRERIAQQVDRLLGLVQLQERKRSKIATLSGGMKRRLTLVRSLINDPELVVLDEPTTGLDPQARRFVWDLIARLKAQARTTFLLTTHYMEEAEKLCDRLVILHQGRILAEGSPRELIREHIGAAVLCLHGEDESRLASWMRLIEGECVAECHEGELCAFLRDGQSAEALVERTQCRNYTLRPANLEDVFLKVAGRGLQEAM